MARFFACGEKVFAKMRGYPAWPARIEGLADSSPNNMKYHVLFYGTMQRGICKSQELFPFLEHKDKFGKLSKAKSFQEALDQIEGLAPTPELVPKIVDMKHEIGIHKEVFRISLINKSRINNIVDDSVDKRNKTSKRKEKHIEIDHIQTPSLINNGNIVKNYSTKPPKKYSKLLKSDQMKQKKNFETCNSVSDMSNNQISGPPEIQCDGPGLSSKTKLKQQKNVETSREITVSSNLNNSQRVQKPNNKLNGISSEPSCSTAGSEEQLPPLTNRFVSRSGRVIKRKTFHDETEDTVPKRKKVASRSARKENVRNQPSKQMRYQSNNRTQNHVSQNIQQMRNQSNNRTQNHVSQNIQGLSSPLIQQLPCSYDIDMPKEKKPTAHRWLATENCMTRLDSLIRAQLGMTRANPEQCISFLEDMAQLELKPLMLKKHPEVVETIKRLRKYVGNASAWNFSEEQKRGFEELARQIRLKAEYIFDKFRVMFSVPSNLSFLDVFADSVIEFQTTTQDWPLPRVCALVTEPKIKVAKSSKRPKAPKSSAPPKKSKSSKHRKQQKSSKVQTMSQKTPRAQPKTKARTTKSPKGDQ